MPAALVFILAVSLLLVRSRANPRSEQRRAMNAALQNLETARLRQDDRDFFRAIKQVLQLQLSANCRCPPERLTIYETDFLGNASRLKRILTMAETVETTSAMLPPEDLQRWQEETMAELKILRHSLTASPTNTIQRRE